MTIVDFGWGVLYTVLCVIAMVTKIISPTENLTTLIEKNKFIIDDAKKHTPPKLWHLNIGVANLWWLRFAEKLQKPHRLSVLAMGVFIGIVAVLFLLKNAIKEDTIVLSAPAKELGIKVIEFVMPYFIPPIFMLFIFAIFFYSMIVNGVKNCDTMSREEYPQYGVKNCDTMSREEYPQ